jgi:Domain of unknown function (DUF1906)
MTKRHRSGGTRLLAGVLALTVAALLPSVAAASTATSGRHVRSTEVPRLAEIKQAPFTGFGFDACTAPSLAALRAWLASPFRALNIYIGGINRACAQPRLDSAWVRAATLMGWRLIPTYVGLQAPEPGCRCVAIYPPQAGSEGLLAAADAADDAASLGIGQGNPIYFDMEGYKVGWRNTSAVRRFLAYWTLGLHDHGYRAGVYSQDSSGIANLAAVYGGHYTEPNDIWIAAWDGVTTAKDPYVPAGDWAHHQRIHQYWGPHTERFGGVRLNIDADWCSGAVVSAASLR